MSVAITALQLHLEYTAWAAARLLESAGALTAEELTRDFGTSEKSVVGTLAHAYGADKIWLSRVRGTSPGSFAVDRSLADLVTDWPSVHAGWLGWLAEQSDQTIREPLAYRDMKGREWGEPRWMIVLHVVNHGTHHRGQVSGFLRALGKVPPVLDLIAFYRSLGTAAGSTRG